MFTITFFLLCRWVLPLLTLPRVSLLWIPCQAAVSAGFGTGSGLCSVVSCMVIFSITRMSLFSLKRNPEDFCMISKK